MKRRVTAAAVVLSLLCAAAGAVLLLALVDTMRGREGILVFAGRFLFSTFLWSALFIPAYLFVSGGLLLSRSFSGRAVVLLNLFILPFLTTSVLHKVVLHGRIPGSFLPDLLVEVLGRPAAAALLIVLILAELYAILALRRAGRAPRSAASVPSGGVRVDRGRVREDRIEGAPVEGVRLGSGRVRRDRVGTPADQTPRRGKRPGRGPVERVAPAVRHPAPAEEDRREAPPAVARLQAPGEASALPGQLEGLPGRGDLARAGRRAGRAAAAVPLAPVKGPADQEGAAAEPAAADPGRAYGLPVKGLLKDYPDGEYWQIDAETRRSAQVLMQTLEEFKISAEVTGIRKGPVITMFEILPSPGVKISRIVALSDNIALRLAASRVRIVAPIPGKHAVGIEVPNRKRAIVSFKEMVTLQDFQSSRMEIPIALGKDISGESQLIDLVQTPHLLIAGATGSGKSVCVNSIICSILYSKSPQDVRFVLIDPKIVELKTYNDIPHLLTPVVTEPKRAFQVLQYCIEEMERRYSMLDYTGVRDVRSYNRKAPKEKLTISRLPYWVVVIDEFADLMATTGKEMEAVLARLAAMARAVGIHLVLATQRPSIEVITGLIKANIPSRIAFMVASKFDSRIIIDGVGAEKLLGQGDMLFSPSWNPVPTRIQGTYLSEEEVEAITAHARTLGEPEYLDEAVFSTEEEEEFQGEGAEDPLMDKALEIVLAAGKASASYLQRRLKVGYNRAARLVEGMERMGIVGPAQGSKPRDVLHVPER